MPQNGQQGLIHPAQFRQILSNFKNHIGTINSRMAHLEQLLVGKEPTQKDRLVACAAKIVPFRYNLEINFAAATTARTPGTVTITQDGYFLLDRVYACWRPTAGGNAGRFQPVSSGNPVIAGAELQAAGAIADLFNFNWELVEGAAQRTRQDIATPGDILYRTDNDGYMQKYPDIFMPASVVTAFVTPLEAVNSAGTFILVLEGRQLLNVVEAGA